MLPLLESNSAHSAPLANNLGDPVQAGAPTLIVEQTGSPSLIEGSDGALNICDVGAPEGMRIDSQVDLGAYIRTLIQNSYAPGASRSIELNFGAGNIMSFSLEEYGLDSQYLPHGYDEEAFNTLADHIREVIEANEGNGMDLNITIQGTYNIDGQSLAGILQESLDSVDLSEAEINQARMVCRFSMRYDAEEEGGHTQMLRTFFYIPGATSGGMEFAVYLDNILRIQSVISRVSDDSMADFISLPVGDDTGVSAISRDLKFEQPWNFLNPDDGLIQSLDDLISQTFPQDPQSRDKQDTNLPVVGPKAGNHGGILTQRAPKVIAPLGQERAPAAKNQKPSRNNRSHMGSR